MSEGSIIREVDGSKGRYVMTTPDGVAELGYSIASPTLVIADHTTVDEGLRGTGAGRKLAERLVADAREELQRRPRPMVGEGQILGRIPTHPGGYWSFFLSAGCGGRSSSRNRANRVRGSGTPVVGNLLASWNLVSAFFEPGP